MQILRKGSSGAAVEAAHRALVKHRHLDHGCQEILGAEFGPETKQAVLSFQSRHVDPAGQPLNVDGVIGSVTWWALLDSHNAIVPVDTTILPMAEGGTEIGRIALMAALTEMADGAGEEGANNDGPVVKRYLNGIIAPPASWCAGLVSYCFQTAARACKREMPFRYSLGARDIRRRCVAKGWVYEPTAVQPEPGDIVFWWRGQPNSWQGHTGLVERAAHGMLATIEGNKGPFPSRVARFTYVQSRMDRILGYARIPDAQNP